MILIEIQSWTYFPCVCVHEIPKHELNRLQFGLNIWITEFRSDILLLLLWFIRVHSMTLRYKLCTNTGMGICGLRHTSGNSFDLVCFGIHSEMIHNTHLKMVHHLLHTLSVSPRASHL